MVPNLVFVEDIALPTNFPTIEEVKNVVFSMNALGAPGPDGFGGIFFYQKYWDIIKQDVYESILQFFKQS